MVFSVGPGPVLDAWLLVGMRRSPGAAFRTAFQAAVGTLAGMCVLPGTHTSSHVFSPHWTISLRRPSMVAVPTGRALRTARQAGHRTEMTGGREVRDTFTRCVAKVVSYGLVPGCGGPAGREYGMPHAMTWNTGTAVGQARRRGQLGWIGSG